MSDFCACDDLEIASVSDAKDIRSARTAHRCGECGRAILPGESYRRVWGVWPGIEPGPMTHLACARCMVLKEFIEAHVPCACLPLGGLLETLQDELDNRDPEIDVLRPELATLLADIEAQPTL